MGEPKFLTTLSETSWEKRRLYFETEASRGLYLEFDLTLGEGSILLLQVRWVVERPRSYFSPAGRFFEPKKFTERMLRTITFSTRMEIFNFSTFVYESSTFNSFLSWARRKWLKVFLRLSQEAALFFASRVYLMNLVPDAFRPKVKARFYCCRYDESLNGRDLLFRRPVDFSSRKSSQKECFAPSRPASEK